MITSTGNAKIRNVVQLRKKAKERQIQDVFLIEGIHMFREVPKEQLQEVYASETFLRRPENRKLLEGISYEPVTDTVAAYMSDTQTPQGIICLVRQFHYTLQDLQGRNSLCMVLENLQDPGNLGTIIRTAEGAGATGILMNRGCVDIYNPKVIRSTMGSILRVPFFYTDDLKETLVRWKRSGVALCAAHLRGTMNYTAPDYTGKTAFLIGNESNGLSEETALLADRLVKIPMKGKVESLNASVAASILLYEAARQRDM